MGFGTIIGQVMFILTIIILVSNFLIQQQISTKSENEAKDIQNQIIKEKSLSEISYINNSLSDNNISIYLRNTGEIKLNSDLFNIYINNSFLEKEKYSIQITKDIINPGLIDPQEEFLIFIPNLSTGYNYFTIVTEFSTKKNILVEVS